MSQTLITPLLIGAALIIGTTGQFLLKSGMDRAGRVESIVQALSPSFLVQAFTQWQIPVAVVFYALGAVLWMAVLSRERVSYAYPFLGLTYVLVMIGGAAFLGEPIRPAGVVGTLLIAVGVVLVARAGA